MTEVKVRIEDELVAAIGQDKVEQFLRDMVSTTASKGNGSGCIRKFK